MTTLQKRNRDRGKRHERAIAKLLGGKRVGVLGNHDVEDGEGRFSVECKSAEKYPKWFEHKIKQTINNCQTGKFPLLVIHKLGQKYLDDWVIIKMEDFLEVLKEKAGEK